MPSRFYRRAVTSVPKYMKRLDIEALEFADKLTDKLSLMINAIDVRIKAALSTSQQKPVGDIAGFGYVKIPTIKVEIKREYMLYLMRYGPPSDGIFDLDLLHKLREEIAGCKCD